MSASFAVLAREHSAAVQAYLDAGLRVAETLARCAGQIDNQAEAEGSPARVGPRCDAAAGLMDEAFHAVRNALEPG